jgi:hypothetical protein
MKRGREFLMRAIAIMLLGLLLMILEGWTQVVRRVSDPYQAEYYSCEGKPDGRLFSNTYETSGYGRFRMVVDLNFDGREDLILSKSDRNGGSGCGNATCPVTIFLRQPDRTYRSVAFGIHPRAAAVRMVRRGEGQLIIYGRVSASEGSLGFFRITSDSVAAMNNQTLHLNDSAQDKALYESWFAGDRALKAEYARCLKGQLNWSNFYE